jgi:K+-transporting ATPase ATPase C chain
MKTQSIIAVKFLLVMTTLTGIIYPVFITGIAQLIFPHKANGSLIAKNGKIIGSELIGQKFDSSIYFWSRPSAVDYNPIPSGASNFGPISGKLKKLVHYNRIAFAAANGIVDTITVPPEMLYASASGLDPHISTGAAIMQIDRVARSRNFNNDQEQKLVQLIKMLTEPPQFRCLGEKRINILLLNLKLDEIN